MKAAGDSHADALLDGLDPAGFEALFAAVLPAGASLVDLTGGRACGDDATTQAALARDLFGDGDGRRLASLREDEPPLAGALLAEHLWFFPGPGHLIAIAPGTRAVPSRLRQTCRAVAERIERGDALAAVDAVPGLSWIGEIEPASGALGRSAARRGAAGARTLTDALDSAGLANFHCRLQGAPDAPPPVALAGAWLATRQRITELVRVPFTPRLTVVAQIPPGHDRAALSTARAAAHDTLRALIGAILGRGLVTEIEPFPETEAEFDRIVAELRTLPADNLDRRLTLGGFADHPVDGRDGSMRCRECIYFLPNRRWCDLPELPLPVEADWFCRLWKM